MKRSLWLAILLLSGWSLSAQNVGIGTATPPSKLSVNGNATVGTGYIGTAGPANGMIIQGRTGIGTTTPSVQLEVNGGAADAVYGHSNNVGGYLGRETNITFGVPLQTLLGSGVYASNPASSYTSLYAQSTGSANVAANVNYSNVWMANYNYVQYGGTNGPSAGYNQLNVTNAANSNWQYALRGLSFQTAGSGNAGQSAGVGSFAFGDTQDSYGIVAGAYPNTEIAYGGYFEGFGNGGGFYAYVGDDNLNRKITGVGTVSEIIPTANHGRITLTASESPEYWYEDYGSANLVNGFVHVDLDPILADIIIVNNNNPIRVFCTPVNMPTFNGVTIMNQTATGFDIQELNGGTHSGQVHFQIVAKPKTNFGEGRFRQANGPAFSKGLNLPNAETANQPSHSDVFEWPVDWDVYNYRPVYDAYLEGLKGDATVPK